MFSETRPPSPKGANGLIYTSIRGILVGRDAPYEGHFHLNPMEIRNIAIIAHVVAAWPLPENHPFSACFALLSDTGKLSSSYRSSTPLGYFFRRLKNISKGLAPLLKSRLTRPLSHNVRQ